MATRNLRVLLGAFLCLQSLLGLLAPAAAYADQATPTPSPVAAPQLTVTGAVVNVRSGPGLGYPVVGKASKAQQFAITGRDAGTRWWQIDFHGTPGWVYAALTQTDKDAAGVKVVANMPSSSTAAASVPAAATATALEAALPPYQDSVTLDPGTKYPVRARSVKGWGYELVDESKDYDLLVNRDVMGAVINQLWPDFLKLHPKGMRISFVDAVPGTDYRGSSRGFGDGVSAWVADLTCHTQHDDGGAMWPDELVQCSVTLVSSGPGLSDLAIAATMLAYGRTQDGGFDPVFNRGPYTQLGKAARDIGSSQWRWSDPFLQVVSLKPATQPVIAAPTPKGPPPPPSGRIAFTRGRDYAGPTPAGVSDIAMVDVKTGKVWVVAENGRQPDVRNDGRIVFNGEGGGRDDLQVVEPDGSNLRPISRHPEDSAPRWSDDGAELAFHSMLAGVSDRLFIQANAEVQEEPMHLQYGNSPLYGRYPFWTSDGLGYSGCIGGNCGIWVTGLNWAPKISQTFRRRLTTFPEDRATDIFADTVLFASPKSGTWDLYTVPAAGGEERSLTNSPSQDLGGTFSTDGNYIAFMSDRGGGWGIWIMESDGANPRQLVAVPEGFGKLWDQDRLSWGP